MLQGSALIRATRPYGSEQRGRSWWCFWSTLTLLSALLLLTSLPLSWWARLAAGFLAGLVICRMFILYHDYQHGAILQRSPVVHGVMYFYGLLTLNPASTWNASHNHHHRHNAKIRGASIGSFPVMTVEAWAGAGRRERLIYTIHRHPLTLALAWPAVFLWGMTLQSFLRKPRQHPDCLLAALLHVTLWVVLGVWAPGMLLFTFILPFGLASAMGAYLFYAQHNFPEVDLRDQSEWDYVYAALNSSSFMDIGPLMHWFTGNIGYHHIHHLNSRIPFYRLPEAMVALEELQSPRRTSLSPAAIFACLRLKLWDQAQGRMVGFNGT